MGTRRRGDLDRRRAGRLQHQPGLRLDRARRRCASKVREMRADIGIALDGDADRVVIVDERGHVVDGDQLLAVIAESWKEDGRLRQARRRRHRDVQSRPRALSRRRSASSSCARRSATATCSSTCASTATMSAASSPATSSCPTTPPPATASSPRCRCWRWSRSSDKPVSEVCHRFEPLPQVLKNVRYKQRQAAGERQGAHRPSPDAEQTLDGHGRLIVRPSGTEPVIRVMGEGDDKVAGRGGRSTASSTR